MGYRTFKIDKGKVWFGAVMEIDSQGDTQNCAVSASQLANGSLVYSVAWVDDKRKGMHFTSENQKSLEIMVAQRTAVKGKYFVDVKALMEKKVNKNVVIKLHLENVCCKCIQWVWVLIALVHAVG